ncbi:nitroreductase family protein [Desulfonatronovibrio hydrogenovorans]|uniref:nitroreductase family protein n=1 Tax=Desulfonatronovibrio hydrogenovorans TaxID=53245 RepID=UPI00048A8C69|nr:nitroreductase family protein [Desulfonatronovibrio hydrogenovorans]
MNVSQAIKARRSIRKYTDQEVTAGQIGEMLEAARLAPSGLNAQPWRFKVIQDQKEIAWISSEASKGQRWVGRAKAVFLCCVDLGRYMEDARASVRFLKDSGVLPPEMQAGIEEYVQKAAGAPPEVLRYAAATNCSIAITQMMLQAVELGLGTCWIGMFDEQSIKDRFSLPDQMAVVAMLAVGHPAEDPGPRPRKELEEIVLS